MLPSFMAPTFTCISISCRGEEAVCVSSLVKTSMDGFFSIQVTKAG